MSDEDDNKGISCHFIPLSNPQRRPLHLRTNLCILLLPACSSCLRLVPSPHSGSHSSHPLPPQAPHSSLEPWCTLFPLLPNPLHPLFTWLCNVSGPGRPRIPPKPSLVPRAESGLPGLLQLPELPPCGSDSLTRSS